MQTPAPSRHAVTLVPIAVLPGRGGKTCLIPARAPSVCRLFLGWAIAAICGLSSVIASAFFADATFFVAAAVLVLVPRLLALTLRCRASALSGG